jgi:hypothetical protein
MAGFVIAIVAFALPFVLAAAGLGRPRVVIGVGGVLALGWVVSLASRQTSQAPPVPLWFVAGLVLLLYGIWCGGLWLGLRVRRLRRATPG